MNQAITVDLPPELLSNREREVLQLIATGKTSQEIADLLLISIHTVHFHRKAIRSKLKLTSIGDIIRYAYLYELL